MACPARVAMAGQENIETVHEPKLIQVADTLCVDRVAVLWKVPTARTPGRHEGACAIKVSMRCTSVCPLLIYPTSPRTDQMAAIAKKGNDRPLMPPLSNSSRQ